MTFTSKDPEIASAAVRDALAGAKEPSVKLITESQAYLYQVCVCTILAYMRGYAAGKIEQAVKL